jgi:single-strand DNA-binding protein
VINDDLERFLALVYAREEGFAAAFSGVRAEPGAKHLDRRREAFFRWPRQARAVAAWVRQGAGDDGREVYLAVRLFSTRRRDKRDPMPVWTLFVDGDGATVPAHLPQPNIILETSPDRHHFFYLLATPVEPARAQQMSARLALAIAADPSGADLTQLMRVPGAFNWKYRPAPSVAIVAITDRVLQWDTLDRCLPPLPASMVPDRRPAHPRPPPIMGERLTKRLSRNALEVWRGLRPVIDRAGRVDRSATLWAIAKDLCRVGTPAPMVAAAVAERDQTLGYRKAVDRHDGGAWYQAVAEHASASVSREADPRQVAHRGRTGRRGENPSSDRDPRHAWQAARPTLSPSGHAADERRATMLAHSLNRLLVVGRVGRDAEVRYLPSGAATATFTVAVNRTARDVEGNRTEATDWFRVTTWDALAERCGEGVRVGAKVLVDGRMESRRYTDRDGIERTAWEVRAHAVLLLDGPRGQEPAAADPADVDL